MHNFKILYSGSTGSIATSMPNRKNLIPIKLRMEDTVTSMKKKYPLTMLISLYILLEW